VLTYNVEGVPRRAGRKRQLREIGARLDALRQAGDGPDIILVQEMFSRSARAGVRRAGYPNLVTGPSRTQRRTLPAHGERKGHKWRKGEWGLRFVGSGLAIASVYPIVDHASEPFSRRACAGLDCLSNKGTLFARVSIPGVPDSLEVFNTHMNAQGASGVRRRRHTQVHHAQVRELADFMAQRRDPQRPVILGGDFNMRNSETRFEAFHASQPLELVHQHCLEIPGRCDVEMSWDGDAPWMDTQDLQLFRSGARVRIRPVRVSAMFDGRPDSPALSDHDGFRVVYELSWSVGAAESDAALPGADAPPFETPNANLPAEPHAP
jgi:endonuclease/exonuclease/phosphatase family metal-dependent hydrolase